MYYNFYNVSSYHNFGADFLQKSAFFYTVILIRAEILQIAEILHQLGPLI